MIDFPAESELAISMAWHLGCRFTTTPTTFNVMYNPTRGASSAAVKRLMIEYKQLSSDPDAVVVAGPVSEDNYLEWEALVPGPDETPYEGGVFPARLSFPSTYPLEPPKMVFDPPLFHPNGTLSAHLLDEIHLLTPASLL